jgi:hypothetical protein
MAASIDRLLQRLGSAGDPGALVAELLDTILNSQPRQPAAAALASRLVASPAALQQLAQLLHQQHAGAVQLAGMVLMVTTPEDRQRLASSLAATPRPPVVEALVGVLGSSTADSVTKAYAGGLLVALVEHSQSCARQAARAGVFVHLATQLRQRPAGPVEAANSLLLLSATRLCQLLVAGSANRAQLAMQQGVLEALPALLGEGYPSDVQDEAAHAMCILLRAAPRRPSSQLAGPIIGSLVQLLARTRASAKLTNGPLGALVHLAISPETREQVANAVAGDRPALLALVGLTRSAPEDQPAGDASDSRLVAMMVLVHVLSRHPQQTEAAFEAGLLDALPHCLAPQADADERAVASDMVRGLEAALSAMAARGGGGASLRLGQLRAAMAQCQLVDDEHMEAWAMAEKAKHQSAASACAACGARAGQPGVRLQVCSRCKRVHYCGPQCQRAHWRAHKADCSK